MLFLHSKGGRRYNPLVLICSWLFRSTFFLLRVSLLAADGAFLLSVHERAELHEMSPASLGGEVAPGQPLLRQPPVSLVPLRIISPLCYPPAAAEPPSLQALCPAGLAGGFSCQLSGGGKMMLSIPFARRLPPSPTGR